MDNTSKRLRILRGELSQAAFAKKIGLKQTTYGKYERGASPLSLEAARGICITLGVNPRWLMYGEDPKYDRPVHVLQEGREKKLISNKSLKSDKTNAPLDGKDKRLKELEQEIDRYSIIMSSQEIDRLDSAKFFLNMFTEYINISANIIPIREKIKYVDEELLQDRPDDKIGPDFDKVCQALDNIFSQLHSRMAVSMSKIGLFDGTHDE